MKKKVVSRRVDPDRDTMRPHYDFSKGVRGVTAARYPKGSRMVSVDAGLLDVFPDAGAVNEALQALAPMLRKRKARRRD